MAIQNYASLQSAVAEWLARNGDPDLIARFPDFVALHEERMYFGADEVPALGLPAFPKLRIREMEAADAAFVIADPVPQPSGFLELIEATLNSPPTPLEIVSQGIIDAYGDQQLGSTRLMAISGTSFRFKDAPGSGSTITLRYFKRFDALTESVDSNWLTATAPSLYLNGCLLQAAIYLGDLDAAKLYGGLYVGAVSGMNRRRLTELASAVNVRLRIRGRTP